MRVTAGCPSGQWERTVNPSRELRRFESFTCHQTSETGSDLRKRGSDPVHVYGAGVCASVAARSICGPALTCANAKKIPVCGLYVSQPTGPGAGPAGGQACDQQERPRWGVCGTDGLKVRRELHHGTIQIRLSPVTWVGPRLTWLRAAGGGCIGTVGPLEPVGPCSCGGPASSVAPNPVVVDANLHWEFAVNRLSALPEAAVLD